MRGDVLISNFNNVGNTQGTGTTIVLVRGSTLQLFAQINPSQVNCPGGIGLTTALSVLRSGYVFVGSLPTDASTGSIDGSGCLIVLNSNGAVVKTIVNEKIKGPWDMTSVEPEYSDRAFLFVSNVLNGDVLIGSAHVVNQGTVVRLELQVSDDKAPELLSAKIVGTGFSETTDPNALIIGPTGLAYAHDRLFVADTKNNRIVVISDPTTRATASEGTMLTENQNLNGPLGLLFSENWGLVAANGLDSNLVLINYSTGHQVATVNTTAGSGGLFGIAVSLNGQKLYYVNDNQNNLNAVVMNNQD